MSEFYVLYVIRQWRNSAPIKRQHTLRRRVRISTLNFIGLTWRSFPYYITFNQWMELISSYGKSLHGGAQLSFRPAGCLYNNFFFLWKEQMFNRLCPKFSGGLGDVVSGREQLRCSTLPLITSPRPPENFGQRLLIIPHLETVNLL